MRTKIITLLRAMTVRERSQWQKYMESDWCCTHPQQRALCALLLTYAPGFEHPDLNKPAVFTAIYGAEAAYDDLKINNLLSDVYESALQYIADLAAADRPIQSALDAVRDLLRRDLDDLASRQLARVRAMLDQKPAQTTSWLQYEQQYWEAAEELYSHLGQRTDGLHLQRQSDAADRAMILEKLRFACAMLSRNSLAVMQTHYTPRWIDPVRDWCIQDAFLNTDPVVQVYLAALQLHQNPVDTHYDALLLALDQNHALFPIPELAALYQYALNYCIRRINEGHEGAYQRTLSLYQALLLRGVLLRGSQLSQWTYKNIATTGLRSRAFQWTEAFLHQYKSLLPAHEQDNAFAFNYAALCFEKQAYNDALAALQGVEFTDFSYHLSAKIIQIKCFYQLRATPALLPLLDASQQLIRRNRQLSDFGKAANLAFLRTMKKVAIWQSNADYTNPQQHARQQQKLMDDVQNTQPIANKEWLLEILR